MDLLLSRGGAISVNPLPRVDQALSANGSDWLWAVTAIHLAAFFGLLYFCFTSHESKRVFHYNFTVALLVGATTYYAQASDLGWSAVTQADHASNGTIRQVFYARYLNWCISFPAVALALGLLSGVSWTTIFCNISIAWIWILSYLAAAYTTTNYKWGFFAFGTFSWIILAMSTLNESREEAVRRGIGRDYVILAAWANLLWLLYLVGVALSDGGNVLGVTGASIFFGIVDSLMVPVLAFGFALLGRTWDWTRLELSFSEFRGEGAGREPGNKEPVVAPANEGNEGVV